MHAHLISTSSREDFQKDLDRYLELLTNFDVEVQYRPTAGASYTVHNAVVIARPKKSQAV